MMRNRALDAGTVRVRWLSLTGCSETDILRWRTMLDAAEVARADRLHFPADREAFIAAHALMRAMLSEATDLPPSSWRYVVGAQGKPAVAPGFGDGSLTFNLSHTRGMVACALARHSEIGVDVEAPDRPRADYATICRSFSPDEARLVAEASRDSRSDLFFRLWTLKESFVKATGEGLFRPLDSFSFGFDPVRIVFHRWPGTVTAGDDATRWQFAEFRPAPQHFLALTIHRGPAPQAILDASAVLPHGMVQAWA
jgi:4'-phosphopantetheinyl transferase